MATPNSVLMQQARESLSGRWGLAIGTSILVGMLNGALSFISIVLFSGPLALGNAYFSLAISRDTNPKLDDAFKGFNSFGTALGTFLLVALFSFLWSLLFVIPGIIAGLAYAMTFYIMADNPTIGAMEAIDESKRMMNGHKWKLFRMQLRFAGLGILCIFTLFIGLFWLIPFMHVCMAKFYDDINGHEEKEEDISDHILVPEIF